MEYTNIYGFSGINRQVSPLITDKGEFHDVQNFSGDKVGSFTKSFDYEIKNAQIIDNQPILGGIDFYRNNGTHEHFVAIDGSSNAGIYKDNGSSWVTQSQSLTKNSRVRFAYSPTLDTLFAANYLDATRSYSGSWSTTTNVTNAPKAKVPFMFGRRLYLLNCDIGGTLYPDRAFRSTLVDTGSITWDTTNQWITFDDVLIGAGKVGENMIIGGQSGVYVFTLSENKYQISSFGCVSHESISSYDKWVFWASRDGMYATQGSEAQKISLPIDEYWSAIPETNLVDINAKVLGHHLYISIGDVTVGGRSLTNVIFDYNVLTNSWLRGSVSENVEHLHTYTTSSGEKLFMGDDDGNVFKLFSSGSQNGSEYSSYIETDWDYGSGARNIDTWSELWGYGDKLSGIKVSYKIDNDEMNWVSAGELIGTSSPVKFEARGYRIKYLLEEMSKGNMYSLHGLDSGYTPAYPREKGDI